MDRQEENVADWRDAAAYAPFLDADRSIMAWEWLRRDPGYRAAARAAAEGSRADDGAPGPERWGLLAFEAPDLAAPRARPVWHADIYPYALPVLAVGAAAPSEALDLACLGGTATIVRGAAGREHLLISDGFRAIRVDVLAGTLARGPVQLCYLLAGVASAEAPLLTLRRLLALLRTGQFSRALHAREVRARRWVLALRAHDALAVGADQREIASVLLSREAGVPRWRSHASSIRSQVQRLVRNARRMAEGGYRQLLR